MNESTGLDFYMGTVVRVVDGSALDIEARQGGGVTLVLRCRLDGISVPGLDDPDAGERAVAEHAKDFVEILALGKVVVLSVRRDGADERGRWPVVVFWRDAAGDWSLLNADLVANGMAAVVPPRQEKPAGYDDTAREEIA